MISHWRNHVLRGLESNEILLTECGIAALGIENHKNIPKDGTAEKHAIALLDRSFILTLIIIVMINILM